MSKQKSEQRKDNKSPKQIYTQHHHDRRTFEQIKRRAELYAEQVEFDNERLPR